MPTFTKSALNPYGTWQSDGMDQSEAFNANRADTQNRFLIQLRDQNKQDDWRKEVALKQLGLQSEMYQGGRQDSADARQAEADRWAQQFTYMTGRDTTQDERMAARDAIEQERWKKGFSLQEQAFKGQQDFQKEDLEDRRLGRTERQADRERMLAKEKEMEPLNKAQIALAQLQLAREQGRQGRMDTAGAQPLYMPQTDKGKQAYQEALAMGGNEFQAGTAAKEAERAANMGNVQAATKSLSTKLSDLYARDTAVIGRDPSHQEVTERIREVDALREVMAQAGMSEQEIQASIEELLRNSLTSGGRTDVNAGQAERILKTLGASFR